MSADIVERLELMLHARLTDEDTIIREAAAEIVRLRGEVAAPKYDLAMVTDMIGQLIDISNGETPAYPYHLSTLNEQFDLLRQSVEPPIAPAEAKDPAPAMPNGVEAADVHLAAEMLTWGREEGLTVKQEAEVAAHAEKLFRLLRAADNRDAARVDTLVAKDVQRVMADGDGFWAPCSGCYETEDGHPVGEYPYSSIFQCALGGGCRECGGLGAVWDSTDYAAMAESVLSAEDTPAAVPAGEAVAIPGPLPMAPRGNDQPEWDHDSENSYVQGWNDCRSAALGAHQQAAPVQAAPQEGEKAAATLRDALGYVGQRQDGDLATLAERAELWMRESRVLIDSQRANNDRLKATHPSACELGAVREALEAAARSLRTIAEQAGKTEGLDDMMNVRGYANSRANVAEAALQHRGDSRGGGAAP